MTCIHFASIMLFEVRNMSHPGDYAINGQGWNPHPTLKSFSTSVEPLTVPLFDK